MSRWSAGQTLAAAAAAALLVMAAAFTFALATRQRRAAGEQPGPPEVRIQWFTNHPSGSQGALVNLTDRELGTLRFEVFARVDQIENGFRVGSAPGWVPANLVVNPDTQPMPFHFAPHAGCDFVTRADVIDVPAEVRVTDASGRVLRVEQRVGWDAYH